MNLNETSINIFNNYILIASTIVEKVSVNRKKKPKNAKIKKQELEIIVNTLVLIQYRIFENNGNLRSKAKNK